MSAIHALSTAPGMPGRGGSAPFDRELLVARLAQRDEMLHWQPARLATFIDDHLGDLVDYAWREVPLYRRIWTQAGVSPADYRDRHSLARFPRVSKEQLTASNTDWVRIARGAAGLCTKGTTGKALTMWLDRDDAQLGVPVVAQGFLRSGMHAGQTVLLLSPAWHRMSTAEDQAVRLIGAIPVFPAGSVLDAQYGRTLAATIARHRPGYVVAMTPMVLALIRDLDQAGVDPRSVFEGVETLMVLGLPLTPGLRRYLARRTGAAVWDRGGSTEGLSLDECRCQDAPHVNVDVAWAEVVDAEGQPVSPGTRGHLVFSKMNNSPSPMIRYDAGDLAVMTAEPCACGNPMPRLRLLGRAEHLVRIGDREVLPWDVRLLLEQDDDLAGRNLVLVREPRRRGQKSAVPLHVVVEGHAHQESALRIRLAEGLGIEDVRISWAGDSAMQWNFRQVLERADLPFLPPADDAREARLASEAAIKTKEVAR
ncbi:MAG: phenylacetate--CoA ligase family protein [Gammaproteobacteria bacterium]